MTKEKLCDEFLKMYEIRVNEFYPAVLKEYNIEEDKDNNIFNLVSEIVFTDMVRVSMDYNHMLRYIGNILKKRKII